MSERELAGHLLAQVDDIRGRLKSVCLDELFRELGVRRIDAAPPTGGDGLYSPELAAIFLNPHVRVVERRIFTGFHEGTHAIVRRDSTICEALAELCSSDEAERPIVEMLCNIGAAEFLMPRAEFVPIIRSAGSLAEQIGEVERTFTDASLPALAYQMAHYASPPGMVLVCAHAPIPRNGGFERIQTHIQYAFVPPFPGTRPGRYRPRRYQVIRDDHPISHVFDTRAGFSGDAYYPYSTATRIPCWCEAAWHARSRRVVAVLTERPNRRQPAVQPSLGFD